MTMRRRTNLLWGVVVLALALGAFANAAGVVPYGLMDAALRAAPALLVLAGLSLLLRGRAAVGGLVALVLTAALVAGVGVTAYSQRAVQQRTDNQIAVLQPLPPDLTLLRLRVETLATQVELVRSLSAEPAITGEFVGSSGNQIITEYDAGADNSATLIVRETQLGGTFPLLEMVGRGSLRLELPSSLLLDIDFVGADGTATLNLSGLALERLNIDLGVGDAVVRLPNHQPLLSGDAEQGTLTVRGGGLTIFGPATVAGRFALQRGGSNIDPIYPPSYNYLRDDILEARGIDTAQTVIRYRAVVPRGQIRVEESFAD